MNPIEKDLRSYFGITSESNILEHYGTKRHSGRYPWGSGDNPYQHSGDFLSRVEELKKKGLSEKEILETINDSLPDEYKMGLTEFRTARQKAGHDRKALEYDQIRALKDDGLGWKEIGDKLGMSESSVRSKYNNAIGEKASQAEKIAATLKEEVDKKGMIDISEGANQVLGVSESKLDEAAYILEAEYGYQRYGVGIRQPTNVRQQTNITVLAKPEFDQKYAYQHQDQIDSLGDYHSDDGGETFTKLQRPSSLDSSRVAIRYGDEGGLDKDGVMEIRRGVPDLDLGKSHYAQVRILVDGDHYLKGMAVYSDDLPDGVDVMFNTNKPSGTPKMKVLKEAKADPDNPFGAAIKANGQSMYIGEDGKEHLSPINKLKEEGDWDTMSRNVSSQFLSKQPKKLIENQLNLTVADYKAQYDEIMRYDNPKAEDTVSLISETKDARTLSSGTIQENLYADFSNKLKAMANQARKEAANMKGIQRNPEAAKTYAPEVASLKEKYNNMVANKPKERKAMLIANANIKAKIQEQGLDPTIDKKEIKKISSVEMQRARDSVGASGRKSKVTFTDREWEAVQAGAISDNMLTKFLNSSDSDEIVKRAMPKNVTVMTSAKMSKANAMLRSGYSYAEIAKACGVPESTVYSALNK